MLTSENIKRFNNGSFDDCPTWNDLLEQLQLLTPEQRTNPVTVELDVEHECIPGYLDLCGPNHDLLDEDIPVIRIIW